MPGHLFAGDEDRCVRCDARGGTRAADEWCEANPDLPTPDETPGVVSTWGNTASGPLTEGPGD